MSEVEKLFRDAEELYRKAVAEIEKDIRDAAEKAWAATLKSTDAFILARTGEKPIRSDVTTDRLHELALEDSEVEALIGRYHTRSDFLHGRCFYTGVCPPEPVKRRIIETKEYIEDVKKLAFSSRCRHDIR